MGNAGRCGSGTNKSPLPVFHGAGLTEVEGGEWSSGARKRAPPVAALCEHGVLNPGFGPSESATSFPIRDVFHNPNYRS